MEATLRGGNTPRGWQSVNYFPDRQTGLPGAKPGARGSVFGGNGFGGRVIFELFTLRKEMELRWLNSILTI